VKAWLAQWLGEWGETLLFGVQILLILLAGFILQRLVARGLTRLATRYQLPGELLLPLRGALRWLIMGSALMLALEHLGVSAGVLWAAFSGFVAVAAVAFFAVWSVLSNLFCAVLIFTIAPFRLGDRVEVLEAADKPGAKGRVIAINLLYTTLEEDAETGSGALVQIPNSLFFQKVVRRWRAAESLPAATFHNET
jgi:small-conductance mechanosensitive channel